MTTTPVSFNDQLTQALEHFPNTQWLAEHSPLSTPYFLGEHLLRRSPSDKMYHCGYVLQELLRKAAYQIRQRGRENDAYYYQILDLSFFRPIAYRQIMDKLQVSRATYYRHRRDAISELESLFVNMIKPALRLEKPPLVNPTNVIGRETTMQATLQALKQKQRVALTGQSGAGKTTFGASITHHWPIDHVFWFTFRATLNDQLSALLFALGHFLHTHGQSALWLQLIADRGKIDNQLMLNLARRDLENLPPASILLCFDEIGLLNPTEVEAHAQICHFLHSLRPSPPMLLIGQQIPIEPDQHQVMAGLTEPDTNRLLTNAKIELSAEELNHLQKYIRGNPRLIELFITLHHSGRPLHDVLAQMSNPPTVEYLLKRIMTYLGSTERRLLAALSVFRRPAPSDAWQEQQALRNLQTYHLIQIDAAGTVTLLPAIQTIIYHALSPEERIDYHQTAAIVRAERGEYTLAAYHYIQANQPETAVRLWHTYKQQEIDQGQGALALEIFANLAHHTLPEMEQEHLILLRNELRLLVGDYTPIKPELLSLKNPTPLLKSEAYRLIGDVELERSQFQASIDAYQEGIAQAQQSDLHLAKLHTKIGFAYRLKRELDMSWREALFARYEVEHLQGDIQYYMGQYETAESHFQTALTLAQELNYSEGEGKTRNGLGLLLLDKGDIEAANHHWEIATQCYRRIGRLTWVAGIQINRAIALTQHNQPERAIPLLKESLSVFESLNHARGRATANFNLAKAYLAQGDLPQAYALALVAYDEREPGMEPAGLGLLAEIKLGSQAWAEAIRLGEQAVAAAQQNQDMFNLADAQRILGCAYLAQEQTASAVAIWQQARETFTSLELTAAVADIDQLLHQCQQPTLTQSYSPAVNSSVSG